jgi:uncharacterized protein YigE (DUF2233 family)
MKKTLNVLLVLLLFQISAQNIDSKTNNLNDANSLLNETINKYAPDLDRYYELSSNLKGKTKKEIQYDLDSLESQSSINIEELKKLNNSLNEKIELTDNGKKIDFKTSIKSIKDKIEADLAKFKGDKLQALEILKNINKNISKLHNTLKDYKKIDSTFTLYEEFKDKIGQLEKGCDQLKSKFYKINESNKIIGEINNLSEVKHQYDNTKKKFEDLIKKLPDGEYSITYNNNKYFAFIADPLVHKVFITDSSSQKQNGISINKLINLEKNNFNNIEMITNGGMFENTMLPVGLLVVNNKIKKEINQGEERPKSNFFMLPNGVFYIQKDSVFVTKTVDYIHKKPHPDYATQSGPMLVDNGQRHKEFKYKSQNVYNRSGVGILPNNRAVFIISENQNTNFFDFSSIFMDIFSCKNALYLDGAISEMYLKNKENSINRGGSFGSLICVERKNKTK